MRGQRIGILTSGGDAPGMNGAIRAVFRRLKDLSKDHQVVLFREGLNGLAGRMEINHLDDVERTNMRDIIHRGGTFIGTGRVAELKPCPEGHPDPIAWERGREEVTTTALVNLRQLGLSGVVVVGGEGSFKGMAHIAQRYQERYGEIVRTVGIPATIDNDIWGTEICIGFDTALNNTVRSLRNLRDTFDSHRRCAILEVMGNQSGWIALSASIAGGATTVMLPEIPETYNIERVLERVRAAVRLEYRYIIVVMAEGVRRASQNPQIAEELSQRIEGDPEIRRLLGRPLETRINIIGYLARGGRPSAFDNLLAARLGVAAADAVVDPALTEPTMVGLVQNEVARSSLALASQNSPRLITPDAELLDVGHSVFVREDQDF